MVAVGPLARLLLCGPDGAGVSAPHNASLTALTIPDQQQQQCKAPCYLHHDYGAAAAVAAHLSLRASPPLMLCFMEIEHLNTRKTRARLRVCARSCATFKAV